MMDSTNLIVVGHLVSSLMMVGMIWTVQIVHYPLMALVGPERFAAYEAAHAPRMAGVVMLPWTVQGLTSAWLLVAPPAGVPMTLILATAVVALVPVVVTVLASIPAHTRLSAGFDTEVHARLVGTNWIRTLAWTAHAVLAVAVLITAG
jgi:hypothetical protein